MKYKYFEKMQQRIPIPAIPTELIDKIYMYMPFEKVVSLSKFVSLKLYNKTVHTWKWAAENGHLEVVKWLHENKKDCTISQCSPYAMDLAAGNGHLEVVKWLHENRTEGCTTDAFDWAIKNVQLEVVEYLHKNRTEGWTIDTFDWAAKYGHPEVIEYLLDNNFL